jgi:hypothetical protein
VVGCLVSAENACFVLAVTKKKKKEKKKEGVYYIHYKVHVFTQWQ